MSTQPTSEARGIDVLFLHQLLIRATRETATVNDATQVGLYIKDHAQQLLNAIAVSHPAAPADTGDAISLNVNEERKRQIRTVLGSAVARQQLQGERADWAWNIIRELHADHGALVNALASARRLLDAPPAITAAEATQREWVLTPEAGARMKAIARGEADAPPGVGERMRELETIIHLAAMLIQPTDDGPQLIGHESFRSKLMMACRSIALAAPAPAEAATVPGEETKEVGNYEAGLIGETLRWLGFTRTRGDGKRKIKEGAVRISIGHKTYRLAPAASSAGEGRK